MIKFVNAKINIGLNVTARREDGYHDLETVFFPVGIESGMPQQPDPFDDILEVNLEQGHTTGCRFQLMGRRLPCEPDKNLVVKAATLFLRRYFERHGVDEQMGLFNIILDKHLPDQAGLGGGSADATFTLMALNELLEDPFTTSELSVMARTLGADCPFFLINKPAFAEGAGDVLHPVEIDLTGKWLQIVKPDVSVSTKEAFAGITPKRPEFDLRFLTYLPLEEWRGKVVNDFEESIFPHYSELAEIKKSLYDAGATYASMSGSGSSIYGIFSDEESAKRSSGSFDSTTCDVWLFKL